MENPFNRLPLDPRFKKVLPYIISTIILVAVLVGVYITSETSNPTVATTPTDNFGLMTQTSSLDITLELVLKIIFVFALIYLFFALLKWWQKKQPGQTHNKLRILETVRPAPRQTFYLIKAGNQEFLVGATDQSINLISEIEPDLQPESELNEQPDSSVPEPTSFNKILLDTIKPGLRFFQSKNSDDSLSDDQKTGIK